MPNSNPACNNPGEPCSDFDIPNLLEEYQYICVSGTFFDELGPVAGPVTMTSSTLSWRVALGSGDWFVGCKNNQWALMWIVPEIGTGEFYATGGTFPNLSFEGGYGSTSGICP